MRQPPPTLDMRPDGSFKPAPRPFNLPLRAKFTLGAVLVAAVGLCLLVAAVAVWFISLILPTVIIAAGIAWLLIRLRRPLFGRPGGDIRRT